MHSTLLSENRRLVAGTTSLGAKIQKFRRRGSSGDQPPNFDDRSGNKQQLIDLPLFDANEDEEIFGRVARPVFSPRGGSDLSRTVCGLLQSVANSSTVLDRK